MSGIVAKLVYDGGDEVHIPSEMGTPREDQMQGTPGERLCELAGRVCYDSLGKGRPSFSGSVVTGADPHTGEQIVQDVEGYHDHIAKVGHGSVWEHFNVTVQVQCSMSPELLFSIFNRPGLLAIWDTRQFMRVTINPRVVNDWHSLTIESSNPTVAQYGELWQEVLAQAIYHLAPHVICKLKHNFHGSFFSANVVEPLWDEECWVSMFLTGSRGLSHELVRHGDFTAISQRSTRYVDESESEWVHHPLIGEYSEQCDDSTTSGVAERDYIWDSIEDVISPARKTYTLLVDRLQGWLERRGADKVTARKQARGAARGYLGNALSTELIFSANLAQWKRMLRQRASVHADAEIRELFCKALGQLKESRYGERFEKWQLQPSPDGIGQIAVESA